jgi:beta-glucosidase
MTTLMRQTWNFSGSIVSDDGAVQQISNGRTAGNLHGHGYAHSVPGAAAAALEGGCDVDYGGGYSSGAQSAVDQGLIDEQAIASAVRRSLSTRMQMGEFDEREASSATWDGNPWNSTRLNLGVIDSAAHRSLAWRAAAASVVLLENAEAARGGLPIQSDSLASGSKVVAVLGEGANDSHAVVNRYTGTQTNIVTLLDGIRNRAGADGLVVRYSENDTSVAIGASVVIVVVRSNEEGESHDRQNLTMRPADSDMLVRLHALARETNSATSGLVAAAQVIVVVISGGPVDTSEPAEVMASGLITSVVAAWQPGEEAGNAVAGLLWGDVDFSASLAVTAYRQRFTSSVDIANMSVAGRGYRFLRDQSLALYQYGHGLSYNSWSAPSLGWSHVDDHTGAMKGDSNARSVTVEVRNTGTRVGSRSILLFAQRLNSGRIVTEVDNNDVIWPNKWLIAFNKARNVKPGQSWRGTLKFGDEELSRWTTTLADQTEGLSEGFRVFKGEYLLTVVDQHGAPAANLTLSIS